MKSFESRLRTRLVFGPGSLNKLGTLACDLGFRRTLLVADPGLQPTGHVDRARRSLAESGIEVELFSDFASNPDSAMVERGRIAALDFGADSLAGLGGGSSMDCAKGINFLLSNGGAIEDYWGYGKAARPMLPAIGVPTTTGTGSEAQSYALISHARTHQKMACGDAKAAFRAAILDPELAVSQPASVRATAAFDAVSHAVETWVTTEGNPLSQMFSREAWKLLNANFERLLLHPEDVETAGAMLLGAHWAGAAIEHSMLGAAHACANPLTQNYGTTHGVAIAALLPHVVRWNAAVVGERYSVLHPDDLAGRLTEMASAAGLGQRLRELEVRKQDLEMLAAQAVTQWTGKFNPRPFDQQAALEIYSCAW